MKSTTCVLGVALVAMTPGCTSTFENRSIDYTNAYGDVANKSLLLSLARLANEEPPQFVQLGAFSAAIEYQGQFSTPGAGYTRNFGTATKSFAGTAATAATQTLAATANLGLTYQETPTFNFSPLSGDQISHTLFSAIPNNVFAQIFTGWHADAAMRTAVAWVKLSVDGIELRSKPALLTVLKPAQPAVKTPESGAAAKPPSPSLPAVIVQPQSVQTPAGKPIQFTVQSNLSPAHAQYQWRMSDDGGTTWQPVPDGFPYSGVASATLQIAEVKMAMDQLQFRCDIADDRNFFGQQRSKALPLWIFNDPRQDTYPLFILLTEEARRAQLAGLIPAPYATDSEKDAQTLDEEKAQLGAVTLMRLRLPDLVQADSAGYSVSNGDTKGYTAYKEPAPKANILVTGFADDQLLSQQGLPLLAWFSARHIQVEVALRSVENSFYEVAHEQQRFDHLAAPDYVNRQPGLLPTCDIHLQDDVSEPKRQGRAYDMVATVNGVAEKPEVVRPILRLECLDGFDPDFAIASVAHDLREHKNVRFVVGDFSAEAETDYLGVTPSLSNRNEFTLLTYLFSQGSIDATKLPVQQFVQVH